LEVVVTVILEEPIAVQEKAEKFVKNFESGMKKIETAELPLYHDRPGVHSTPIEKRSPYWQPVDELS
jgi:hypothetical protein